MICSNLASKPILLIWPSQAIITRMDNLRKVFSLYASINLLQLLLFVAALLFFFSCSSKTDSKQNEVLKDSFFNQVPEPAIDSVVAGEANLSKQSCFITAITEKGGEIFLHADYIQRLDGERAIEEAKKRGDADTSKIDGKVDIGVVNDYYIINDNPKIRRLPLDPSVRFEFQENPDGLGGKIESNLKGLKLLYKDAIFELTLRDGKVVKVYEIFVP
jgi:hypothetical protein